MDPGLGWRVRRFLGSPGHVVGALFAIVGIILLDVGLTHWPLGILIIVALYVIGFFLAARPQMTNFGVAQTRDADRIEAGLDELLSVIRKRVAPDIYMHVVSIRDSVVFTLQHTDEKQQTDQDLYTVRQTAMTYLPEALNRYLSLPRGYAERQLLDSGRTSHDELLDQLALMDDKTRAVAEAVIDRDSQQLLTHGRFIADRFSESKLEAGMKDDRPD